MVDHLYIVSLPESDDGIYVFSNFAAVERSIEITWAQLPNAERPTLCLNRRRWEGTAWSPRSWDIVHENDRIIGMVREVEVGNTVLTEGTHF